jgi:putative transposase
LIPRALANTSKHFAKHEKNLKRKQQKLAKKDKAMKCGLGGVLLDRIKI